MKFALKNLFKQKKLMMIYGLTLSLMTLVCYIFLVMLYDPYFRLETSDYRHMIMGSGTTLLMIIFAASLIVYTNIYILESKNKEISLMRFHGMTNRRMLIYQLYQNTFMYVVYCSFGMIMGYIITPYVMRLLYQMMNIEGVQVYSQESFFQTIYMMICLYVVSLVLNYAYMYRGNLLSMLNYSRQNKYRRSRVFRLPSMFYFMIYFLGLVMIFLNEHNPISYILFSVFGAIGGYGLLKYCLPEYIEKRKKHQWLNQSKKLVVFGELFLKFKFIGLFMQLLIIVSIILTTLICFNQNNKIEMYRMIVAYMILIPMIIFCLTYKNMLMNKKNKLNLSFIYKLGMMKSLQKKFIQKELLYLYGLLLLLPGLYMISILIQFRIYEHLSIGVIIIVMGYFIMNIFISMSISYLKTIHSLKEV